MRHIRNICHPMNIGKGENESAQTVGFMALIALDMIPRPFNGRVVRVTRKRQFKMRPQTAGTDVWSRFLTERLLETRSDL